MQTRVGFKVPVSLIRAFDLDPDDAEVRDALGSYYGCPIRLARLDGAYVVAVANPDDPVAFAALVGGTVIPVPGAPDPAEK